MPIVATSQRILAAAAIVSIAAMAAAGEPVAARNEAKPTAVTAGKADPRMAPFDDLVAAFVRDHKIPGAAVAVLRHGRLIYARGFGLADVEANDSVRPDSLFRIASISKPTAAVAVLQLVEQG